jgi:hypothetical protein
MDATRWFVKDVSRREHGLSLTVDVESKFAFEYVSQNKSRVCVFG